MILLDYPWYLAVGCLLLGTLYAWLLYRRSHLRGALRWVAAGLRCTAVATVAFLLLGPVVWQTSHEQQKPVVWLLEDVSQSVKASADSAYSLQPWAEALQESDAEVYYKPFGDAYSTPMASALADPSLPRPQAVVLASDGLYNRGANPIGTAERMGCPVYTVALGDTTPQRDALLTGLRHNRIALLGNQFGIELTAVATDL